MKTSTVSALWAWRIVVGDVSGQRASTAFSAIQPPPGPLKEKTFTGSCRNAQTEALSRPSGVGEIFMAVAATVRVPPRSMKGRWRVR